MSQSALHTVTNNHIAHVRLNKPDTLNAILPSFWDELAHTIHQLGQDRAVRVIVLSAAGKHFSSGLDLTALQALAPDGRQDRARQNEKFLRHIRHMQKCVGELEAVRAPVIAAIHGACLGAALDIAAACDIRFAARDALFAVQGIKLGIVPELGALQRLPRLMPAGLARELVYTGRRMGAEEALRSGFVNQVFETPQELLENALKLAHDIAGKSPLAIEGAKENMNYARDHSVADGLAQIAVWSAGMMLSRDLDEGIAAQQQKRAPKFEDLL